MKTLSSLRKKTSSPLFIGFACASSLYLGIYLLCFSQSEKISLKQEGNSRFTLSIKAFQPQSQKSSQTPKNTQNPKPSTPPKAPKVQKPLPAPKPTKTTPSAPKPLESSPTSATSPSTPQPQSLQDKSPQGSVETLAFNQGISDDFLSKIHSLISSHNPYPKMARRQRLEGEVIVEFILEKSGEMSEVKIIKSNAKEILQRSALKALHTASRYFPLPQRRVKIRVPILYKLA